MTYPQNGGTVEYAAGTDPDRASTVTWDHAGTVETLLSGIGYFPFEQGMLESQVGGGLFAIRRERLLDGRWSLVDAGPLLYREVAYHDTASPPSQTRSDPTVLDPTTGGHDPSAHTP